MDIKTCPHEKTEIVSSEVEEHMGQEWIKSVTYRCLDCGHIWTVDSKH